MFSPSQEDRFWEQPGAHVFPQMVPGQQLGECELTQAKPVTRHLLTLKLYGWSPARARDHVLVVHVY